MFKYPVAKPDTSGNELLYLTEAIAQNQLSSQGDFVPRLEQDFANYIGTKYAVACSSGTTALTLSLAALGIGPGDEVIVPDFTMIATAWAVTYVGATPVFVDCGEDLNINTDFIEHFITKRTKAIIPVHIYGRPADMEKIMKIAHDYNLRVIEDAAEAHGAKIKDKMVGAWGHLGCFSLYANKIISTGEGGIVTTDDPWLYEQLKHLRGMSFDQEHTFLHKKLGYNFRMTNLQAAVGVAQLERISSFILQREQIRQWYDEYLKAYTVPRTEGSVLWMYDLMMYNRDEVLERLKSNGIESRLFFKPMVSQPMYKVPPTIIQTKAARASSVGFYLPTYTDLTQKDIEIICTTILNN